MITIQPYEPTHELFTIGLGGLVLLLIGLIIVYVAKRD